MANSHLIELETLPIMTQVDSLNIISVNHTAKKQQS